jgi:crotonobetainyl-CoA:carnitine CoA-transferase CaiB-like acyl-CoA transferase
VLDLSAVVMGPYATQILADFGADVITVEPPGGGGNRGMGPGPDRDFSGIALNLLRNKRSVCLDLKAPPSREAVLRLAATCDVVVTNMRARALKALGLGYDEVRLARPDVIYCHAQGFRSQSDRAGDPAYDDIIQAECGVADAGARVGGVPRLSPTIMADKICGLAIVNAVLAALLSQRATGQGQYVEVPMVDVMTSFMLVEHGAGAISAGSGEPAGYLRVLNPERGPQQTRDGWINILPYSSEAYDAIFAAGGRQDLVGDERTRGRNMMIHAESLYRDLRPIVATRTTEEWLTFCRANQIPVGRVVSLDELVAALPIAQHPEVGAYHTIPTPAVFHGTPCAQPSPAPRPGQHNQQVFRAIGLSQEQVGALVPHERADRASTPGAQVVPGPSPDGEEEARAV